MSFALSPSRPVGRNLVATYASLFELAAGCSYFRSDAPQPVSLKAVPTPASQQLMMQLGLIIRDRGSSQMIAYNTGWEDYFLDFLRGDSGDQAEWLANHDQQWLSFTCSAADPGFFQYSNLPFDFDPRVSSFYISNRTAHQDGSPGDSDAILTSGKYVDPQSFLPKARAEEARQFRGSTSEIEIVDVSGNVVLCYPRFIPVKLAQDNAIREIGCAAVRDHMKSHPGEPTIEQKGCLIQFGLLGAGKYTIRYVGGSKPDEDVIYPANDLTCVCFVDIFLSDPSPAKTGVYPVIDLFPPRHTQIEPVSYSFEFKAREVYWNYIVSPPFGYELIQPEFRDQHDKPVAFDPSQSVFTPSGLPAVSYCSAASYPLQNQPTFWMQLSGKLQKRVLDDQESLHSGHITARKIPLVNPLPAPPLGQIVPQDSLNSLTSNNQKGACESDHFEQNENTGVANIYVHL